MAILSTIVMLVITIVGADKTCTKVQDLSHLVQSLQSCANAIADLQPSSEKCSPEASLLQKIERISSTLANITQQIAGIEESIALNEYNITANKISIEENAINLQGNITTNNEMLDTITTYIAALSSQYVVCNSTGWTRVAYLDMSLSLEKCPTMLRLYNESGVRACGRQISSTGSCDSATFYTYGVKYSEVCGKVIGYQYGRPDATRDSDINSRYVDGISITHGSPRHHIWTFAAGFLENGHGVSHCPCNTGSTESVPSFVGNSYFCESGTASYPNTKQLYTDDPLWDGEGCGSSEGPCCDIPGIPWFHKVLNSTTTDYIELRVCGGRTHEEDTPIGVYEIYIK